MDEEFKGSLDALKKSTDVKNDFFTLKELFEELSDICAASH